MLKGLCTALALLSAVYLAGVGQVLAQTQGEIHTNQKVCDVFRTLAGIDHAVSAK